MELTKHIAQNHEKYQIKVSGDRQSGDIQDKNMKTESFRKDTLVVCLWGTLWTRANCSWLNDRKEQTFDDI